MKYYILIACCFFSFQFWGQNLQLKVIGENDHATKIIDSLGYITQHENLKGIINTANTTSEKLFRLGYISNRIKGNTAINDSVFLTEFEIGKKTHSIGIILKKDAQKIINIQKDTIWMNFSEIESYMNNLLKIFESEGFSLTKIGLLNFTSHQNKLLAELNVDKEKKRFLDKIVINGYEKFPKSHQKNIMRLYRKKTFNKENLNNIYKDFEKFRFVTQPKYPEILFTKDSTEIYVYLEKAKANSFDGYIGFSNNDENGGNIIFSGYLDLTLANFMNSGEVFSLYWKSDGQKQTTFDAKIEIPYIFESPIGIRANLNIFKQDSIFQNTKTGLELGYYFNYNTRVYAGYQSTESSDILNQNNYSISDFKNYYYTSTFDFKNYNNSSTLFPEISSIEFKIGSGKRNSKTESNSQYFLEGKFSHLLFLNEKNRISLRSHNFYLNSQRFIINELYRFGGINSVRGFLENSLQASVFTSLLTEYIYILSPNLYIHSIIDYGYYQDGSSNYSDSLLGLGFGFGMNTKNGLFKLNYANGSTKSQNITFSNSLIHISFITKF